MAKRVKRGKSIKRGTVRHSAKPKASAPSKAPGARKEPKAPVEAKPAAKAEAKPEPIQLPKPAASAKEPKAPKKLTRAERSAANKAAHAAKRKVATSTKPKASKPESDDDAKVLKLPSGAVAYGTKTGKKVHFEHCRFARNGKGKALADTKPNRAKGFCKCCGSGDKAKAAPPKVTKLAEATAKPCKICKPSDAIMTREAVDNAGFVMTAKGQKYHKADCRCVTRGHVGMPKGTKVA